MSKFWQCGEHKLDLSSPKIMGILNVTPDSFYDGGKYSIKEKALLHAISMVNDGAAIIDVGGESTRPGAIPVSQDEELDRVIPAIELIKKNLDTIISIDTTKPAVMKEAIKVGASIINSVDALETLGALEVAANAEVGICLMHKQGLSATMQHNPQYSDVIIEIASYLVYRAQLCLEAGVLPAAICVDPGFGFGKTLTHNLAILKNLTRFVELGFPLLVGMSRKSMIGEILNAKVEDRLYGGLTLHTIATIKGAHILRVHDVKATSDMLKVINKINHF